MRRLRRQRARLGWISTASGVSTVRTSVDIVMIVLTIPSEIEDVEE